MVDFQSRDTDRGLDSDDDADEGSREEGEGESADADGDPETAASTTSTDAGVSGPEEDETDVGGGAGSAGGDRESSTEPGDGGAQSAEDEITVEPDEPLEDGVTVEPDEPLDGGSAQSDDGGEGRQSRDPGRTGEGKNRGQASEGVDHGQGGEGVDRGQGGEGVDRGQAGEGVDRGQAGEGHADEVHTGGRHADEAHTGEGNGQVRSGEGNDQERAGEDADHVHDHAHGAAGETLRVAVVTVSSTRSLDDDPSGDAVQSLVTEAGHAIATRDVLRDDLDGVQSAVSALVDRSDVDAIVTSGGTGVTPDDVTIEAVRPLFDKELPGFGELFRILSYEEIGTRAVATRTTAGVVDDVAVFCLPGSEDAARLGTRELVTEELSHLVGLAGRR